MYPNQLTKDEALQILFKVWGGNQHQNKRDFYKAFGRKDVYNTRHVVAWINVNAD